MVRRNKNSSHREHRRCSLRHEHAAQRGLHKGSGGLYQTVKILRRRCCGNHTSTATAGGPAVQADACWPIPTGTKCTRRAANACCALRRGAEGVGRRDCLAKRSATSRGRALLRGRDGAAAPGRCTTQTSGRAHANTETTGSPRRFGPVQGRTTGAGRPRHGGRGGHLPHQGRRGRPRPR